MGAGGDRASGKYQAELLEDGSVVTTIPFQVGSADAKRLIRLHPRQILNLKARPETIRYSMGL